MLIGNTIFLSGVYEEARFFGIEELYPQLLDLALDKKLAGMYKSDMILKCFKMAFENVLGDPALSSALIKKGKEITRDGNF